MPVCYELRCAKDAVKFCNSCGRHFCQKHSLTFEKNHLGIYKCGGCMKTQKEAELRSQNWQSITHGQHVPL